MRQGKGMGRKAAWAAALAAGAAVALAWGSAQAQISGRKGPIDITGDSMDVRDAQHLVEWKGRVEALQNGDRLRSNTLDIYYKPSGAAPAGKSAGPGGDFGAIDRMEAIGDVYFVTPTQVARGDKAVYTATNDTIVITGDVVLTQGENVGRGSRLVIDLATGHSSLEGGPSGRPRVVFYPKQNSQGSSR